ncbi:MAG: hypothetical protein KY469_08275 [Actinobacteria bacterium]|nr:hypothetical protein [Actinomycetota bacterium]
MADRYTSRIALVLDRAVEDVAEVIRAAVQAGDLDRHAPVGTEGAQAQEVNWGGRMQKAVVRNVVDAIDEAPLLRTETYIGGDGLKQGMKRQAQLVQALARQLEGRVRAVRDLSAQVDRDLAWLNRIAVGAVEQPDAISSNAEGEGTWWVYTHGAARFDVPDLELYGLSKGKVEPAQEALRHIHSQLLDKGLKTDLSLPDGTPLYLVPVLDAWQHVPLDWPGVGKAGVDRGRGLDGPRATLSVLHKPRFGRYKKDLEGVLDAL